MEYALAAADLAMARAGAGFLAEAAARGLPTVLIPYPYAANNHQRDNARVFAENGAAMMMEDRDLNGSLLADTVISLLEDKSRLARMSAQARTLAVPDAAERIARVVAGIVKQ